MDLFLKGDNLCDEKDLIVMDYLFVLLKMCID